MPERASQGKLGKSLRPHLPDGETKCVCVCERERESVSESVFA
jgi:hypothetical protein